MSSKKTFVVEFKITSDSDVKTSALVTQQEAVVLQLYCESKNYHHVKIVKK
jgi:hypothetical protein